jgi:hypothetical protein
MGISVNPLGEQDKIRRKTILKKSLLLAILGLTASMTASYGQGLIGFSNYYYSYQTTGITYGNGPDAGLGVGPEISVELLYGASTDKLISQLTVVPGSLTEVGVNGVTGPGPLGVPYAGPGVFDGGTVQVNGGVPGTFAFAIYATGTYEGQTYAGWSGVYDGSTQPSRIAPPPDLPTNLKQSSFTVDIIPEPSTMVVAGLGGLSFMLFRRKQA